MAHERTLSADRVNQIAGNQIEYIINAIPGGVAIYKISDIIETVYFSDGIPGLTGYAVEEYEELSKKDAAEMIYREDRDMVFSKVEQIVNSHGADTFEFRKKHRNGAIVWVRVQAGWIGEDEGYPLLHCVFHDISESKEAKLELNHLINSIPGGIASYRIEQGRFIPVFYSDGLIALTGHTREEFSEIVKYDALDVIYEADRARVEAMTREAVLSGEVLDVSYRTRHKDGSLVWIHLNGRRMGPLAETMKFYAVFTGMSGETHLFQSIADETADGVYVIDRESYDLLYASESRELFGIDSNYVGRKCYEALRGRDKPCANCLLEYPNIDGQSREMEVEDSSLIYRTSFRETSWNGIPAYINYVRNVTEEVRIRRENERLEQYFETLVKNLSGGIAVMSRKDDGSMQLEFLSEGFLKMTEMTKEEAWDLYGQDVLAGVHPGDIAMIRQYMKEFFESDETSCEIIYRLKKGNGDYLWIRNTISYVKSGAESRVYANYHDVTRERENQKRLRDQYRELIMQHYRTQDPNVLVLGHCNITTDQILEISSQIGVDLLALFGEKREDFFTGLSNLIVDKEERETFLDTYLNEPSLEAFMKGNTELIRDCFLQLPGRDRGQYVRFKVNLVKEPDTGDITGILTVTDITKHVIEDRIMHQISIANYDFVIDLDLEDDYFRVLAEKQKVDFFSKQHCYSEQIKLMLERAVVPKDREQYRMSLDPVRMRNRLREVGSYTFFYSMVDETGETRTKTMTVSEIDLRIGRICLVRSDITDSVREQQNLLNVVADTFEMLAFIRVDNRHMSLHTRKIILENLPPYIVEVYNDDSIERVLDSFGLDKDREKVKTQFRMETMLKQLQKKPAGYEFVFACQPEDLRYKQINVRWGDEAHSTICMVRSDVTEMLMAERQTKKALEEALYQAEEASRAKTNFLSSMSHDIRTPMNAIIGMTSLALSRLGDPEGVEECLQKISYSSKHLLRLINDILDMSKIERGKIALNREVIALPLFLKQLTDMMQTQMEEKELDFKTEIKHLQHPCFYGDPLRMNQILINILGNAIKFTPEGGKISFEIEEIFPVERDGYAGYRFTVRDTGIGMSEEFQQHVFEPFTRSDQAVYIDGTGLGLSITKGLVDLMEGTISVESKPDQGSAFLVELECEIAADIEEAEEARNTPVALSDDTAVAGRHFLIAEDNEINAEIICELIKMFGGSSVVRIDGQQAVEAFQLATPGTFDAILMDIQMPVLNGYDATRAIRSLEREDAGEIPIIAMTANAFAEDVKMAFDAGMNAHVPKPVDVPKLLETLNHVLNERTGKSGKRSGIDYD